MAQRIDIPVVSGRTEDLLNDIREAWEQHSKWIIPTAFFFIGIVVLWSVIKKRIKK